MTKEELIQKLNVMCDDCEDEQMLETLADAMHLIDVEAWASRVVKRLAKISSDPVIIEAIGMIKDRFGV